MGDIVTRTLPKGTVVKIQGIPAELVEDAQASTGVGNWSIIDRFSQVGESQVDESPGKSITTEDAVARRQKLQEIANEMGVALRELGMILLAPD